MSFFHLCNKAEKKPKQQRPRQPLRPHVSTARLLAEKQRSHQTSTSNLQLDDVVETPPKERSGASESPTNEYV